MSETNNLDFYRIVSVASVAFILSLIIIIILFPIFSGNYFYEIGTIMIYSGELKNIPKGWQICNGENGTPDLTDKFVVGSCNSIPKIESESDNNYIGYGIHKKYVIVDKENTDTTGYNKARSDGKIGFMEGNLPYLFGQTGENDLVNNLNTTSNFNKNYDKGTSWYKEYRIRSGENMCDLEEPWYTIPPNGTTQIYNYKIKEDKDSANFPRKGKFIKDGKDLDDLCSGSESSKYVLNDKNLKNMQLSYAYSQGNIDLEDDKFNAYVDITKSDSMPQTLTGYDTNLTVEHIGTNPINKRRLFRDYEDYKLYLKLNESCYNCLPMNHKFTLNSYDNNIYVTNTITEIEKKTNTIEITFKSSHNIVKGNQITLIVTERNFVHHFKVTSVNEIKIAVNNKLTNPDESLTQENLKKLKGINMSIIIHTDIDSYLNNTPKNLDDNNLIIKNNKVLGQRFMNDFVYDVPYNNNPKYYKLIYIIRVK